MAIECGHGRLARKCELCELEEALTRISALEAERDKAVELLRTECLCYEFSAACSRCKQKHVFLASIGEELPPDSFDEAVKARGYKVSHSSGVCAVSK